jgi:hypothetical protein
MARALNVSEVAVAEFLPWIEAEMVKGRAERREAETGDMSNSSMIGGGDG